MATNPYRGRILVIDDHVALAHGFASALTLAGYDVTVAHSAEGALAIAQQAQPDAIILDFQMPFVNGVGFLYRLREQKGINRTPVLVVTGQTLSDETRSALQYLDADIRLKPLGMADLLSAAHSLVNAADSVRR